jgi:hypothetical protein
MIRPSHFLLTAVLAAVVAAGTACGSDQALGQKSGGAGQSDAGAQGGSQGAAGGTPSGGGAAAGTSTGGTTTSTGGKLNTGGTAASTGGISTGGINTGGINTGGISTGGTAPSTGGISTGGISTGGSGTGGSGTGGSGGADSCTPAFSLRCADRLSHSTTDQGRPNQWSAYACTARWESGREVLYDFRSAEAYHVTVGLTNAVTGLGIFLLSVCDPSSPFVNAVKCQPIGGSISFDAAAGQSYLLVVDGYDNAEGSYTIEVDCGAPDAG